MLQYFELVFQLLDIDADYKVYREFAERINQNPHQTYVFLHRHSFLFSEFLRLVLEEIDLESYMRL